MTAPTVDRLVTGLAPLAAADTMKAGLAHTAEARLDSLVAHALRRAPALQASKAEVSALREEVPAAGALPDPMIAFGAVGEDYPGAAVGTDPMAVASLEISQTIPWPGKRARRTAAAAARVPELAAMREAERRALAADVREMWTSLQAAAVAIGEQRRVLGLLDVLEPQALARYETGQGAQADWLALRRERLGLSAAITDELAGQVELAARLAAALDDTALVSATGLPPVPRATEAVRYDGDSFAEVAQARAATESARSAREAAASESRPDLFVGAEYGWRGSLAPMVTARVGFELPLWKGRKQDAMARAAGHREAAARAGERGARLRAQAEARTLAARWQAAEANAARLREQVLPLLALGAEAARARYLAGDGPAEMLIEILNEEAGARAELAREEAAAYAAFARLRALAGHDPVAGDGRNEP